MDDWSSGVQGVDEERFELILKMWLAQTQQPCGVSLKQASIYSMQVEEQ